jgi:hypothetical protein
MPTSFDFITDKAIRRSLESDHEEMHRSAMEGNNKCAVIIAGSIIEALLIDYLRTYPKTTRSLSKSDPLQIPLAEAIDICHSEGVIDAGTRDICTVIRGFRNLIHPGLLVRKGEPIPDQDTAQICLALVNKIIKQMESALRQLRGLTSEQVVSKVLRDTHAISLVTHLLADMSEYERERLLLDVLPPVYATKFAEGHEAFLLDPEHSDTSVRDLEGLYHAAFEGATQHTKEKATNKYVEILKTGDTEAVETHTRALFKPSYLGHVADRDHLLVISHLLSKVGASHTSMRSLQLTEGITQFLKREQVDAWLTPLIKAIILEGSGGIIAAGKKPDVVFEAKQQILFCGWNSSDEVATAVDDRLAAWVSSLEKSNRKQAALVIKDLRDSYVMV